MANAMQNRSWRRSILPALLLVALISVSAVEQPPSEEADFEAKKLGAFAAGQSEADAILAKTLPAVHFDNVDLEDAIEFLRDVTGANIVVNWKALQDIGIDKNRLVSLNLRNPKLSTVLKIMLNDAASGPGKAAFELRDDVIVVSSAIALERKPITRIYNIRDLLVGVASDEKQMREMADEVIKSLKAQIDPTSWSDNGGKLGSIRFRNGLLLVMQSRQNQERVAKLLDKLREATGIQVSIEARFVSLPTKLMREQKLDLPELFTVKKTGEKIRGQFMDSDRVNEITRAVGAADDATVLTAPRATILNGQQASVVVAQQQAYISGWSDPDENGKRKQEVSTADTGVFLDVQATVSADRKYVTLVVKPRVSQLVELKNASWDKAPEENLKIQKPVMQLSEVNTIVSVPDEGTFALLIDRKDDLQQGRDHTLMLLLRPTIIIQHQAEQKPK